MIDTANSQVVWEGTQGEALIRKTPGVCGGDACIRNTRIMVWLLEAARRSGRTDTALLADYPELTPADLRAAWAYAQTHGQEIDEAIRLNTTDDE